MFLQMQKYIWGLQGGDGNGRYSITKVKIGNSKNYYFMHC